MTGQADYAGAARLQHFDLRAAAQAELLQTMDRVWAT
jgi:hypothetical protein